MVNNPWLFSILHRKKGSRAGVEIRNGAKIALHFDLHFPPFRLRSIRASRGDIVSGLLFVKLLV